MAKKALINRGVKRVALAQKCAAKRAAIFAVINDASATEEARFEARLQFHRPFRAMLRCSSTPPLRLDRSSRVVPSVNLVWVALKSVKSPCVVKSGRDQSLLVIGEKIMVCMILFPIC